MPLRVVVPPVALPMSVAEVKAYRRIEITTDDAMVAGLISGATDYALTQTQRQLVSCRYQLILDAFPGPQYQHAVPFGVTFSMQGNVIEIPRCPVLQIVSIQYLDMSSNLQTVPPANYTVDLANEPARIRPIFGQIWPPTLPQMGAVIVTFDAGHASPFTATATSPGLIIPTLWPAMNVGDAVYLSNSGGALPTGLSIPAGQQAQLYYVQAVPSAGQYALSAAPGGSAIAFTDAGSGSNFMGQPIGGGNGWIPDGLKLWMQARIGAQYEIREEVLVLNRGKVEELPYIDGLLDDFRMVLM
jgi:uncharacterized phiE125 gp8 family phage protein